ncbi:hypothetical protein B0I37DRAFT_38274 [Chaetomium sp. MPI-CAGE-AT-0009]|nr:hypothetical protein B0I37DRAFT_38274 [Chaetomium sp. MPI-CAGE-AT-0009]
MAGQMDLGLVTEFLSEHAGKHVSEMANLSPETLQRAKDMYLASHGRLPSPPPQQPLQPSGQLEAFTKEFSSSVNAFLERSRDREASAAFTASSWDGLQREAAKAWAAYNSHQKRRRNWRRPFEVIDHAAEKVMTSCCIEFLLELVPHGEYSSLLTGGLTLAYHAALKKEKFREDILELFDSLSERGKQTKARIRLYSHDPDLRASAEELYMAVLDCVRHSMTWLDARSAAESFKAFFQQSRYGSKLEDARENMNNKAKKFDDAVDLCLMRQVSDIHDGVEWLKIPALATFSLLAGFVKDFPAMAKAVLLQQAQESQGLSGHFLQASYMQPHPAPAVIASWQLRQGLAAEFMEAPDRDAGGLALSELEADATTAMRHIPSLPRREAMGLLTLSPAFAAWLRGVGSAFVVVHDGEGVQQQGAGLSTLSHLCGLMACTMRAPGMYTLAFFCGLHTAANARLQGGRGAMIALTLQLLQALGEMTFPSPLDPTAVMQRLVAGDLEAICSVFSMALGQVPAGMVFVLIDGAHWNGTEIRSAEMRAVVRFLHRTMEQTRAARRGVVLKILVSNPSARQRFEWNLAVQDLYMERQVLARGNSGAEEQVVADAVSGWRR